MKKTLTEPELRALVEGGMRHAQIAAQLGRSRNDVALACAVLGITAKRGRPSGDLPVQSFLDDLRTGLTLKEIGRKHGITAGSVYGALSYRKLPTCARALLRAEAGQRKAA